MSIGMAQHRFLGPITRKSWCGVCLTTTRAVAMLPNTVAKVSGWRFWKSLTLPIQTAVPGRGFCFDHGRVHGVGKRGWKA